MESLLWSDVDSDAGSGALKQAVYSIRRQLGVDAVPGANDLRVNPEIVASDVREFETALHTRDLEKAATIYTGPFLQGVHIKGAPEFERWVETARNSFQQRFRDALETLARNADSRGSHIEAAALWRRLVADDPVGSRSSVGLINSLAMAGDSTAALAHYRVYEKLVLEELGMTPDPVIEEAVRRIRDGCLKHAQSAPRVSLTPTETRSTIDPPVQTAPFAVPLDLSRPSIVAISKLKWFGAGLMLAAAAGLTAALGFGVLDEPSGLMRLGRSIRITSEAGLEIHPAISPNGQLIAYATGNSFRMRIMIRSVTGGRTIPLSDDSNSIESRPKWSPDGSQLLYLTRGGLAVSPSLGGSARTLFDSAMGITSADWSSDGQRIAFVRADSVFIGGLSSEPAYLVAAHPGIGPCSWQGSKHWLACVRGNTLFSQPGSAFGNLGSSGIVLVSVVDGRLIPVTQGNSFNHSPIWGDEENLLYFVSDRDGPRDIYSVRIGPDGRPQGGFTRISAGLDAQDLSASWKTQKLAYSVYHSRANVWTVPVPAEGTITADDAVQFTSGNQTIESVRVSSDGRWLIFDSNLRGNSDIYRIPVEGGRVEQLTSEPFDEFSAHLSPDGSRIVYHTLRSGKRQVEVKPLNGAPIETIRSRDEVIGQNWSPDGNAIVFRDWDRTSRMWLAKRAKSGKWSTPKQIGRTRNVLWSRDPRFVVSTLSMVNGVERRGISIVPVDPNDPVGTRVLYSAGAGDAVPLQLEISPDGETIYFKAHDEFGFTSLWAIPFNGGKPRPVVRFTDPDKQSRRVDFTTDGKRFFFTIDERHSDISVVDLKK